MTRTALVVKGTGGAELLRLLEKCSDLELVALACPDGETGWLNEEQRTRYFVTSDPEKIAALPELEAVVDASGDPVVFLLLTEKLGSGVKLEKFTPGTVLNALVGSREQLLETRLIKGELLAILNSVQDAIEVVDEKGIVKYVNPAFTRVTGIADSERVNRSIFDVSPHGALARSLIQQKPITGYRTYVGGSDADVISNASPIVVDGELKGAVVVFQPVSDLLKLMDELKHSNTVIDNLYAQIDQLSGSRFGFDSLTGQSRPFIAAVEKARKVARSEAPVLISGESGSGKSLFARAIHNSSPRSRRPLIVFDCSAVPDSLQEIEIFGCEKGALPGVLRTRLGKIELAGGSTLFFREINALSPFLQKQLVKVLDEQHVYRIGGEKAVSADVRFICSAGERLLSDSRQGFFSEELYRRISQVMVEVPPLRRRADDIPLLAAALMERLNRKLGKKITEISPRALQELVAYEWPGNIGELKSAIERSMVIAEGQIIEYHHLPPFVGQVSGKDVSLLDEIVPLDKMEEIMLKLALARFGENLEGKKKAAQALNISLATLYNKLKKYGS